MIEKSYKLTGMTCGGCKASVEKKLEEIASVEAVNVDLAKGEVALMLQENVPLKVLSEALPAKYTITDLESISPKLAVSDSVETASLVKTELQQLFPLFLIFFYITAAAILINFNSWSTSEFMLDFMGLFYIVFSFFKMLDLKGFPASFRMYDPLAKVLPVYGWVYPFIETVLGLFFLFRFKVNLALIITVFILGLTTIGVTKSLLDKKSIQCACLGTALKLPMTKATFIENSIMLVMAVWMLLKDVSF